jgi:inorganic phosphate transporter, PiT family
VDAATLGLLLIIVVALAFDYTNGFHDSANGIATSVSTKALTPRAALILAAAMNVVGALVSTKVAATVGAGIIATPAGSDGLVLVFSALLGAISWNLLTWYFGLPSSSSHALIGGLVGAALAASQTVQWSGVMDKVVVPMVLSPLVGFGLAYLAMVGVLWGSGRPSRAGRTATSGTRRSARPR